MNMGFVNVAIAKEDRVPINSLTTARLLKTTRWRSAQPGLRNAPKHKTHAFQKVEERALRLDSSISLPSHQPNYCGDDNVDERVSDRGRGRGVSWLLPAMTEGAEQRCGVVLLITFNVYL